MSQEQRRKIREMQLLPPSIRYK